jgi:hypothetical protein
MTLKEIIKKFGTLRISKVRRNSDEFCELVFYNKDTDEWNKLFTDILGHAAKPAGMEPTDEDQYLTKDYGGIWFNQTVFKREFDDVTVIAMFWPWQNGIQTTLKIARLKKEFEV